MHPDVSAAQVGNFIYNKSSHLNYLVDYSLMRPYYLLMNLFILLGPNVGFLLCDSGYPCEPYLMTLHLNQAGGSQQRYSLAQSQTRIRVEQAFGILKNRFPMLRRQNSWSRANSPDNNFFLCFWQSGFGSKRFLGGAGRSRSRRLCYGFRIRNMIAHCYFG